MTPSLLWFRHDLRLADNPALSTAAAEGPVLPVFVYEEGSVGGAARWWLHHSLHALAEALRQKGAPLLLLRGNPAHLLPALALACRAQRIHTAAAIEPAGRACEAALEQALPRGTHLHRHAPGLLHDPSRLLTQGGGAFQVFGAFARALQRHTPMPTQVPPPLAAPRSITPLPWPNAQVASAGTPAERGTPLPATTLPDPGLDLGLGLADLALLPAPPQPDWAAEFPAFWQPGEANAVAQLESFVEEGLEGYAQQRDLPARPATSRLSAALHWGEITVPQCWHALAGQQGADADKFRSELLWREFSAHLLWHHPGMAEQPLRAAFRRFPWQPDAAALRAWQQGQTGYPLIDAGMRQLWRSGWMHNRVRMACASFLVKHLLQPWQAGAAWFMDTLVDADLAANSANWQWVAGCGADAAPYFRIFNPTLQAQKFDPEGSYIRQWVPELADLPTRWLYEPFNAPPLLLQQAGVTLGQTYPSPVVALGFGRARALEAFATLRQEEPVS